MKKFSALVLVLFMAAGCSKHSQWQGTREERNGVIYVHNPQQGVWLKPKELIFEKLFSMGTGTQGKQDEFANPTDIVVSANGNILICDAGAHTIRVYDSEGTFLRTVGRKGNGPGELTNPLQVATDQDNDIYVLDLGNRRVNIYSPQGEFLQSFTYPFAIASDMLVTSAGEILLAVAGSVGPSEPHLVYVFDREGQQLRAFGEPVETPSPHASERRLHGQPKLAWLSEDDFICAFSYPYKIQVYALDGTLKREITRDSPIFTEPELDRDSSRLLVRSRISWCAAFPDGRFLVGIEDHGPEFRRGFRERMRTGEGISFSMDLFDEAGRFLQSFPVDPAQGAIFYVDREGYAYLRSESLTGAMISKCRLKWAKGDTSPQKGSKKRSYSFWDHLKAKRKYSHPVREYALADREIVKQEMVLIPGGEFIMGSDDSFFQPQGYYDFGFPPRRVRVDSFYLDKYEVTNAMYKKFVEATGYPMPQTWTRDFYGHRWDHPNQPVTKISWEDAMAYAKWAGKRLPTEAEWEYAARAGLVQKAFPWGDQRNERLANFSGRTKVVGLYPPNAFGLYDMAGNASEWVYDYYDKGPTATAMRVTKGNCFRTRPNCILNAARMGLEPNRRLFVTLGFRCAKSVR